MKKSNLKRQFLRIFALRGFARMLSFVTDTRATIFFLHRFSIPELGVVDRDPEALRRNLARLRKERYQFISLGELFRRLHHAETLNRVVAFTMDDGYFDQASIAEPLFAEFDCPVTTFLATGFLDGQTWFWWDKLEYIFARTQQKQLRIHLGRQELGYRLLTAEDRIYACKDLNARCQDALETDRLGCILDLSRAAEVELSDRPPCQYAPLTWDQARRIESNGIMTFGPHTVTHPVLSSAPDLQAKFEIQESWMRLRAELNQPVPVFCYPNGRSRDFGEREMTVVRRLGLLGAVSGIPGEIRPAEFRALPASRFRVPRFPYSDHLEDLLQCVSGVEQIKFWIRQAGVMKCLSLGISFPFAELALLAHV